jgi:hypothetical protein
MAPENTADEAQAATPTAEPAAKRMTVAELTVLAQTADQKAAAALRVAQGADDMVAAMSEKITDLGQRLADQDNPIAATLEEDALSDRIDGAIERKQLSFLARIEDAERRVADAIRNASDTDTVTAHGKRIALIEAAVRERQSAADAVTRDQVDERIAEALASAPNYDGNFNARLAELERRAALLPSSGQVMQLDAAPEVGGVYRKVLELMRVVTHIGKEKQANLGAGGRFKFRGIDDAMDAVGHGMREVGLVLETKVLDANYTTNPVTKQTDSGPVSVLWTTAQVTMRYTFIDPEDGSRQPFEMVGEGRDAADKGTSKAASMAAKYGLFQALMIPVTGLDDSDNESPQIQQQADRPTQSRPAEQQAEQQPAKSPTERATDALTAIRGLNQFPIAEASQRLANIAAYAEQQGLGEQVVSGGTLRQHIAAAKATFPPPVTDDEPPWSDGPNEGR